VNKPKKQRRIINFILLIISLATALSLIFKDYTNVNLFGYIVVTSMIIIVGITLYLLISSTVEKHRRKQKLRRIKTIRRNIYNL